MSTNVNVVPSTVSVTTTTTTTRIEIYVTTVILGTQASILVRTYDVDTPLASVSLTMSGADYTAWGTDDTYLRNWVLTQLNLTPA